MILVRKKEGVHVYLTRSADETRTLELLASQLPGAGLSVIQRRQGLSLIAAATVGADGGGSAATVTGDLVIKRVPLELDLAPAPR